MAKIWTQYFEHIIVKEKHTVKSVHYISTHLYKNEYDTKVRNEKTQSSQY